MHVGLVYSVAYPGFQRGGCLSSGPIRKAWGGGGGGGVLSVSGPVRKAVGVGGGVLLVWPNTSAYLECAGGGLARAKILATTPILETEGVPEPPEPPPPPPPPPPP